jgi:hypothetical protein
MAGTTGLEPATSAVTVLHSEVSQRLTNPWGTHLPISNLAQIRNQGCSPGLFPIRMITDDTESINQSKENSTCLKSGAHKAPNRCSGAKVVLKARTVMPALRPARIPAGVSSTTTQWSYRTPRRPAAFKYPSGSGFPRKTSSPLIRSGGTGRPAHSSLTVANALLAEVTTAH